MNYKLIIATLLGLLTCILILFVLDPIIVDFVILTINPNEAYYGLTKILTWFILLWCTLGISVIISTIVGVIFVAIFD